MRSICFAVIALVAACSDSPTSATDLATPVDLAAASSDLCGAGAASVCGHPCDRGNSLGVGQYCEDQNACKTLVRAHTCTSIMNTGMGQDTYFCSFICSGAGDTSCGENAFCGTDPITGFSACVPNRCAPATDGGAHD